MNSIIAVIVVSLFVIAAAVTFLVFRNVATPSKGLSAGSSSPTGSTLSGTYPNLGLISSGDIDSVLGGGWNEVSYYQGSNLSKSPGAIRVMNVKYLGVANFAISASNVSKTFSINYGEFSNSTIAMQIYKLGTTNMNPEYNGSIDGASYTMLVNEKGGVEIFYANYRNYDIVMMYTQNNTAESLPNESDMIKLLQIEIATSR